MQVVNTDTEFRVNVDVQHFKPDEINIKTKDNRLIINARHEERADEHGFIMREFTRQYVLPKVSPCLSSFYNVLLHVLGICFASTWILFDQVKSCCFYEEEEEKKKRDPLIAVLVCVTM